MRTWRHATIAAAVGAAMVAGFGFAAPPAEASYIVTLTQQGSNVVANGSGSIDLTELFITSVGSARSGVFPDTGLIITGPVSFKEIVIYAGLTGPVSFGSGGTPIATSSGSGDPVGIGGSANQLFLPVGYASGSALSDNSTYDNATFASLGVMPGTYVWTLGGQQDDSFTLDIETPAVPEPGSLALLGTGLAAFGLVGFAFRRRRASV
ncbi:MAG: PEP-CTERM sorting domain-containing protein [Acetobacteraceae bacterium]